MAKMVLIVKEIAHELAIEYLKKTVDFKNISPKDFGLKYLDVYNEINQTSSGNVNNAIMNRDNAEK